ncbi:ABC transporter ATP-binding protein [Algiphilus sp.]|uniref:ABC transporter ATP-binding protein n=1 Tax=Algiphilus sp. TaxID=1872431 RepID=UPI003C6282D3
MDDHTLIRARGLTRRYGPTVAVDGLDLTLRKGEILGLLGPNGAGKSTTMKMLTGCLAPSAGSVQIRGQDPFARPEAAKRHLGYMPEVPPVYPELTVDEYLRFAARLHGVPRGDRAEALARAKTACGLDDMGRRLIGNLSKGYQQRTGLAQAIIHNPDVIVLDEPTVGLDPIQIREIRALVTDLGREHSVLLSSHILPEIQAVCDRVMIIAGGRVVYADSMAEAMRASFSSVIIGLREPPPENELLALADVGRVERIDAQHFRLHCRTDSSARDAWAAAAARHDWGLFELRPELRTLEDIFVELTTGETGAASPEREEAA